MALNPFMIDCDTGRDDAVALLSALALGLPIAGVTACYGNVGVAHTTDNTARILALAGREDIPLFMGPGLPSRAHAGYARVTAPRQLVSGNGLCDLDLPKASRPLPQGQNPLIMADEIRALAEKHGRLDYVILSPATHFADLLDALGDDARGIIGTVTMMGGKFDAVWAEAPGADFNVVSDPYAVRAILERGFEIRFVPMDTAWPVTLTLPEVETLKPGTARARIVRDLMIAHIRHFAPEPVFRMVDPCVLLALTKPALFTPARIAVDLDESSPAFARLTETPDGFPAAIYRADPETQRDFLKRILTSLELVGM
jgi:inosine-uridine nucleoside N-ribohydrolase